MLQILEHLLATIGGLTVGFGLVTGLVIIIFLTVGDIIIFGLLGRKLLRFIVALVTKKRG